MNEVKRSHNWEITDDCNLCGICVAMLPNIFTLEEGRVVFENGTGNYGSIESELIAVIAAHCPMAAIREVD